MVHEILSRGAGEDVPFVEVLRPLLRTVEDPRHRAILSNYRRHALLEVSGRYEEILTPAMTISNPVYRLTEASVQARQ